MNLRITRLVTFSILGCVIITQAHGQRHPSSDNQEVLARVGPRTITIGDYWERIELMPWPGKDDPALQDSAKLRALISLVGEKLLSLQAADAGFIQDERTTSELRGLERLFARDELYRTEALNKASFNEMEFEVGFRRYAVALELNTYVLSSQAAAERLLLALNDSSQTEQLVSPGDILSHDTITVTFGDLTPSYEEAAYSIDSAGNARMAFTLEYGWTVFQLLDSYTNPSYAKATLQERQSSVEQKVRKRKELELAVGFGRSVFTERTRMDSSVFLVLADSLRAIMWRDTAGRLQQGSYGLFENDIELLKRAVAPFLHRSFVTMGQHSVSVENMLDELTFHPIAFQSLRRRPFMEALNRDIKQVAEAALFSQEALRRRMHQRPRVQQDLTMWVDAKQSDKLMNYLIDSLARHYGEPRSSDERRDSLRYTIAFKSVEAIHRYVANLATKFGVEIDFEKLKTVQLSGANMVTRRFIGFGGAMMAVPAIPFLWNWFETWKMDDRISP